MDFIRWLNVQCLYICLIYFIRPNDSATLADLKIACGIKYKPDRQDMTLDYVPCQCTSILLKSSDYTENEFDELMSSTPKVPIFLIEKIWVPFDTWITDFQTNPKYIQKYVDKVVKHNFSGLFFDNVYYKNKVSSTTKDTLTNGLIHLFETIRKYFASRIKVIILGFVIPHNIELATNVISFCDLDSHVDAYIGIPTKHNKLCTNYGSTLFTSSDVRKLAQRLSSIETGCIQNTKIVLELNLYVKDALYNQEISYEESCSLCSGSIVCRSSLSSLYNQGVVINKYNLAGAYVRYCNQDDMHGMCSCNVNTVFPGLGAIVAGIEGLITESVKSCISYGVPGVFPPREDSCPGFYINPDRLNDFQRLVPMPTNMKIDLNPSLDDRIEDADE